jgi:hypothetical protein
VGAGALKEAAGGAFGAGAPVRFVARPERPVSGG